MGPELGDGSFCSGHKIPHFFLFQRLRSRAQCLLSMQQPPVSQHQGTGAGKTQTTLQMQFWGWVCLRSFLEFGLFIGCLSVLFFFLVKSHLSSCTTRITYECNLRAPQNSQAKFQYPLVCCKSGNQQRVGEGPSEDRGLLAQLTASASA